MLSRIFAVLALATAGACSSSPTVLHLVAAGDEARVSSTVAATSWTAPAFGDGTWLLRATPLPLADTTVHLRQRFDVGADAAAYAAVDLDVHGAQSWTAWINGVAVGSGAGPQHLALPASLLTPTGNVLAVEARAPVGTPVAPVLSGAPSSDAPLHVTLGPWLVRPRPDGVTVVFETSAPTPATVVVEGRRFDAGAGTNHVAEVSGLAASSQYRYHVEVAGTRADEDAALETAPPVGAPVRFVVWGDHRTDGDDHRREALSVLADAPDFIVDTGDMVDTSSDGEWRDFFAAEYPLLRSIPLVPALGNHEYDSGGASRFRQLFPVATTQAWSFDEGCVHVAVLDSNDDLADQARWLDADLADASARGKTLFIAMHWGLASSGKKYAHGIHDDVRAYVAPVAKKYGVVAILAGHDHFYERGVLDGVTYVVSGGGGAPVDSDTSRLPGTEVLASTLHYVELRVAGRSVHLRAVTPDGNVIDDATL